MQPTPATTEQQNNAFSRNRSDDVSSNQTIRVSEKCAASKRFLGASVLFPQEERLQRQNYFE